MSACVLPGDLNNDDYINVIDVIALVNMVLSDDILQLACADLNDTGNLNILDILLLVNLILSGDG